MDSQNRIKNHLNNNKFFTKSTQNSSQNQRQIHRITKLIRPPHASGLRTSAHRAGLRTAG
jgi:hypothetical protein